MSVSSLFPSIYPDPLLGVSPWKTRLMGDDELKKLLFEVADRVAQDPTNRSIETILGYFDRFKDPAPELTPDRARVLYRIIPDFIDTFLKAFNILEAGKGPQSIWDYHALIAIYVTALSFPSFVVHHMLQLVSAPLYAYGLSFGVVALTVLALYTYLKWLRPLPKQLPNCIDVKSDQQPLFVRREREVARIKRMVESGWNVLITGDSGVGKSSVVRAVGRALEAKRMQQIENKVFGDGYLSATERLSVDMNEAENYPGKVVFFIDEIQKILSDEQLVKHLQDKLRQRKFQLIGTLPTTQNLPPDFLSRFQHVCKLENPQQEELRDILKQALADEGFVCKESFIDSLIAEGAQPDQALKKMAERLFETDERTRALAHQIKMAEHYPLLRDRLKAAIAPLE